MGTDEILTIICDCARLSVDWSQFWPSIIATFVGVVAAIYVQKKYEDWKQNKEAKEMQQKIILELEEIKSTLKSVSKVSTEKLVLSPISLPIYKGLVASAKISLFSRFAWYTEFCEVYNMLETYNSWHTFRTYVGINKNTDILILLQMIEKVLLGDDEQEGQIDSLIAKMNEKNSRIRKRKSKRNVIDSSEVGK